MFSSLIVKQDGPCPLLQILKICCYNSDLPPKYWKQRMFPGFVTSFARPFLPLVWNSWQLGPLQVSRGSRLDLLGARAGPTCGPRACPTLPRLLAPHLLPWLGPSHTAGSVQEAQPGRHRRPLLWDAPFYWKQTFWEGLPPPPLATQTSEIQPWPPIVSPFLCSSSFSPHSCRIGRLLSLRVGLLSGRVPWCYW